MKLTNTVQIATLIIYHQGTEKILLEGPCLLQNLFCTTKSKDIGGIGMGDDH